MFINNIWYTLVLKINLLLQILPYLLTIRTFKLILKVALSSLKVYSWNIPACINAFPCTHLASSTVNFNPLELTKQVAVCSNQIINWAVCKGSVFILLLLLLILRLIITRRRRITTVIVKTIILYFYDVKSSVPQIINYIFMIYRKEMSINGSSLKFPQVRIWANICRMWLQRESWRCQGI